MPFMKPLRFGNKSERKQAAGTVARSSASYLLDVTGRTDTKGGSLYCLIIQCCFLLTYIVFIE